VYDVSDPTAALSADQPKQQVDFGLERDGAGRMDHVYAIVRSRANEQVPDTLILSSFRNDRSGALFKSRIRAGMLGQLQPMAADDRAELNPLAPVSLAERGYIVAGQVGSLDEPRDSRLVFYNPIDGNRMMDLAVDLYDAVGLAYSPKTGNLYAADIAWMAPDRGGVYRIDDAQQAGERRGVAIKVADIERPSALAFGPDGALYVTAFGPSDNAEAKSGKLLRIRGEL
jgi:hypothetical protein